MYELLPHKADIIVKGAGSSIEDAFCEAAKAMFSAMVELSDVKAVGEVKVEVTAESTEDLLVAWLNELLSEASLQNVVFCCFEAKIERVGNSFKLLGIAGGEKINPKKHHLKTEVKGATYSGLKVAKKDGMSVAQCVVDV